MKLIIDDMELESDNMDDWLLFAKLSEITRIDQLLGILEYYNPEHWT